MASQSRAGDRDPIDLSANDEAVLNHIFNQDLPYSDVVDKETSGEKEETEESDAAREAKCLEVEGVKAAEAGDIEAALNYFSQAVDTAPGRASGYNNRAQALRLQGKIPEAITDLDKALELSGGRGTAACQAYTQRGLIKRLQGDDESALADFEKASALGGKFAKQMCIALNPYAALCNQMMMDVVQKIRKGELSGL